MKKSLLAALLLGAATVAGFAPFGIFPLPFVTLALLFLLWRGAQTPRYAALIGFAWGLGFFLTGVSWVYVSLHDVGGMALPLAATAALLFCVWLALFPALAGYAFKRLAVGSAWRDTLLVASSWMLGEWLRGWLLTGFPWLSLGYSQVGPSPLAGFAPLFGSYGVGFVLALMAALLAFGWWRLRSLVLLLVLLAAGVALKHVSWTTATGEPVSVSLLQGNIPQSLKWDPARLNLSFDTYRRLAREHLAQLVVLPETAIPLLFDQIPHGYLRELAGDRELLLGAAVRTGNDGYANAALVLDRHGSHGSYAKSHLVPFGEYVPPGFAWFFDWVRIPMSDFGAGAKQQKPIEIANLKVAMNICYEDLFGEEIIRQLPEATLLVNLSNTAWFGHSLAQPQHLQIARMRAIETGRPMLRATNTGMTAAIEPDGSVSAVLPAFAEGVLTVTVQGYSGATPYVRIGNGGALLLAVLALVPALLHKNTKTKKQ
ncbi:Apolipoprotein N-acyltransferase [Georgfuchsia toluolica]|uniref:Apolipoprotein N-acyltransferase n=1 Tax=Georgfuchsia toluolica TaxID=424218 RepID=A0A916N2K3_9PROT|nr:apolipoprotein N-acyltransferase [Georgfuchsia toluolica]CAG4884004.1 Apolipoprotein N-acyltransferase [Georgfuchsia toluolica]